MIDDKEIDVARSLFTVTEKTEWQGKGFEVYFQNGAFVGDIFRDIDGDYKFYPEYRGGRYFPDYGLLAMYVILKDLNKGNLCAIDSDTALPD